MAASDREVAILLAAYNGEKYLEVQLQSLVAQTFSDFVCYIHDDGSSDRTLQIIKEYESLYPDMFQLLEYEGAHGAIGNFLSLAGFIKRNTKEPYVFFCDQDDYWYPEKLEKELYALKKWEVSSQPLLVYCDQEIVDSELNTIAASGMAYSKRKAGVDDSFKELVFENCAAGCTIGINRLCLDLAMDHADESHVIMHDWWFMLIARCFGDILYVDEPLMKYRQHGSNSLGADNKSNIRKIKKYLKNLKKSVSSKAKHVKKCELQIQDIALIDGGRYALEVKHIIEILGKSRLCRMAFFYKEEYIKFKECFTLLFV